MQQILQSISECNCPMKLHDFYKEVREAKTLEAIVTISHAINERAHELAGHRPVKEQVNHIQCN